jgi:5-formyltetrahydrofolate cyclo-ligase
VAAYASLPAEPGTGPLREALRARGVRILLPIVLGSGTRTELDLDWAQDDGEDAPSGGMGGPEPIGPRLGRGAIAAAEVVLTPALAIDREGFRLGMGGGCYDRALPRTADGALRLVVVHDGEVLGDRELPVEPHDVPVDAVLTPQRWIYFTPRGAAAGCVPRRP